MTTLWLAAFGLLHFQSHLFVRFIFINFLFRLFPLGVTATHHPFPSPHVLCILLCHAHRPHARPHHIHIPLFWSSFSSCLTTPYSGTNYQYTQHLFSADVQTFFISTPSVFFPSRLSKAVPLIRSFLILSTLGSPEENFLKTICV